MNIFKSCFILILALTTGCAHIGNKKQSSTQWLDSYKASGTLCIDGYVVNSAAAGCKHWTVRNIDGIGEIRCTEKQNDASNHWVDKTFVFMQPTNVQEVPGFFPICADASIVFGVINLQ